MKIFCFSKKAMGAVLAAVLSPVAVPAHAGTGQAVHTGVHDFDFLMGEWQVHHRRLKERLAGSQDWLEFSGTLSARPMMGGSGNVDDNVLDMPGGAYRAIKLHAFDTKTRL